MFKRVAAVLHQLNRWTQPWINSDSPSAAAFLGDGEARYRQIVETASEGIWIIDSDHKIQFVNLKMAEMLGYSLGEMVDHSMLEFIDESAQAIAMQQIESHRQHRAESHDFKFRHKNGSEVWVLLATNPILDGAGHYQGSLCMITDISDRKRAELALKQLNEELEHRVQQRTQELQRMNAQLRASEARFQTFMDNSPMAAWITDANGVMVYLSQTYRRMFQFADEEAVGKSVFDLYPQAIAQQFLSSTQTVVATQQVLETIEPTPRPDGTVGDFLVYKFPIAGPSGQPWVGGVAIDMTDRKRAESAIRLRQEQLQLALEGSGDGLWDWNILTGDAYLSPRWLDMLGYGADELPGHVETWQQLIHPEDQPHVLLALNHHLQNSSIPYQVEYRAQAKTGNWRWIANYGRVVARDGEGKPLRMVGLQRDISDRKQTEQELQESRNMLKRVLDTIPQRVFWKDRQSRFLGCNPAFANDYQLTYEQIIGKTDGELPWAEWADLYRADDAQVMNTQTPKLNYEEPTSDLNGEQIWIRSSKIPLTNSQGDVVGILGCYDDVTDRKKAEQALQESRNMLKLVLDTIPQRVFWKDRQFRFLGYNSMFADDHQLSFDAIVGKTDYELPWAEWADLYRADDAAVMNSGVSKLNYEEPVRNARGEQVWIRTSKIPLTNSQGDVVGILGCYDDVTERRQAEQQLQSERLRLQLALEAAEMGTWESNGATNIWSARTEAIFGYAPGTFPGNRTTFLNLLHEADRARVEAAVAHSFAERSPYSIEYRIHRLDGELRWVAVKGKVVENEAGSGLRMVGVALDITERKRAEEVIQQSERDLRTIFNNVYDAIFISDLNAVILDVNDRALELNRTTREQLLTASVADISAPDAPLDQLVQIFERAQAGANLRFEWMCRRLGDRSLFPAEVVLRVVTLANRPVYIAAIRDITERKHLEQELRQINLELERRVDNRTLALQRAMEAAEAANKAKSTFLANMSHELRTPLNAILGFAQLMSRDPLLDLEKRQQLSIINRSGEHLLNLINDILEMSKIEAGRISFNPTAFDLHSLLGTLEEMFRLRAIEKDLQLQFERSPAVPRYIETDENKLRQVLINLVGNAIKFTQDGQVTLRVTVESPDPTRSYSEAPSAPGPLPLRFAVQDTGAGIDLQELEGLFEPFKQSENRQITQEGTGLGLPISRQFVRLMGGELTVVSTPGQGSIFQFSIQVQLTDSSQLPSRWQGQTVTSLAPDQPIHRVLVVEDQSTNQQLLMQLLQSVGFEVQAANNGQEAIALWESWHPHFIWMDMRMPIMNGYEATQQIRQREQQTRRPAVVIVALTASAFEEERARVLEVGCNDFVRKPFQEANLLEKMADYLGVQYLYREVEPQSLAQPAVQLSSGEAIAALGELPTPLLKQLYEATIRLDDQHLVSLLGQVEPMQPALAAVLRDKLNNFDLETILDWLQTALPSQE